MATKRGLGQYLIGQVVLSALFLGVYTYAFGQHVEMPVVLGLELLVLRCVRDCLYHCFD